MSEGVVEMVDLKPVLYFFLGTLQLWSIPLTIPRLSLNDLYNDDCFSPPAHAAAASSAKEHELRKEWWGWS